MDTPFATNIITLAAVIVALVGLWFSRQQARNDWSHAQKLAREERQHQIRPVMVPVGEFESTSGAIARANNPYMGDGLVNWHFLDPIRLELENMGGGVALNVHCVLYGSEPIQRGASNSYLQIRFLPVVLLVSD